MFYDNFAALCKQKGVTPSAVMRTIGLNKSSASYWKRGSTPSSDTLQKLADYFGVPVDFLLGLRQFPDDFVEALLKSSTGKNISILRERRGLTQKELSEKTGIPLKYLRSLESGSSGYFPTEDDLLRLSEVFRVPPRYIQGTGVTQEWMQAITQENCYREMNDAMQKLNIVGQQKAVERVRELTEIPRYRVETAPKSPPAPTEGKSTIPPPDAPETPPEEEWDRYGGDRYGGRRDE